MSIQFNDDERIISLSRPLRSGASVGLTDLGIPTRWPNERWRLDYVAAAGGESWLVLEDEFTRERLVEKVVIGSGADVVRVLDAAANARGVPTYVVSDMAMEFMSEEARQWVKANRVSWTYLARGRFRRE